MAAACSELLSALVDPEAWGIGSSQPSASPSIRAVFRRGEGGLLISRAWSRFSKSACKLLIRSLTDLSSAVMVWFIVATVSDKELRVTDCGARSAESCSICSLVKVAML